MEQMQLYPHLKQASSVLIVCHKKPDGDTLGSGLAVYHLCHALGVTADIVSDSDVPRQYEFLMGIEALNVQKSKIYDLVVAVDCAEPDRMGKFADYAKSVKSINIDHHITNEYFCKYNYVVGELSSTCELMYDILLGDGVFPSGFDCAVLQKIAACLYTGLSTDTGHFMHSCTTAKTLRTAAALAETGINVHEIAALLYRSSSIPRKKLLARAIQSMRFFDEETIGIATVRLSDLEQAGAVSSDTEGIIDHAIGLKPVLVAACINEHSDKFFKVSYRSKGIDVTRIASIFGGGGHMRAAGCVVSGYYEDVVDKVVKAIRDELDASKQHN